MHGCMGMHKIPHSFDPCDCIVFRLYSKSLSIHGPLACCTIFLNKLVTHVPDYDNLLKRLYLSTVYMALR